jgi:hypothetical protein
MGFALAKAKGLQLVSLNCGAFDGFFVFGGNVKLIVTVECFGER